MRVIASVLYLCLALSVVSLPTLDDIVPETAQISTPKVPQCKSFCAKKLLSSKKACFYKSKKCASCPKCDPSYQPPWKKSPCPRVSQLVGKSSKKPADVIPSLKTSWKLQLPCGDMTCSESPTQITNTGPAAVDMKVLAKYDLIPRGYNAKNKQYCSGGFFASKEGNSDIVVLYDPVAGVTTRGSQNPRVELREMKSNKVKGGFSMQNGKHTLSMTQKIMHLPAKKKSVCFVQLFDAGYGAFIEVMTRICSGRETMAHDKTKKCTKGKVYTMVFHRDSNTHVIDYTMLATYTEGTKFTLKVEVENGIIKFDYKEEGQGQQAVTYTAYCNNQEKCGSKNAVIYFKTGAYLQKAPKEDPSDYVLSYQYAAKITHTE